MLRWWFFDEDGDLDWNYVLPTVLVALFVGLLVMVLCSAITSPRAGAGSRIETVAQSKQSGVRGDIVELKQEVGALRELVEVQKELEEVRQELKAAKTSKETPKSVQEFLLSNSDEVFSILKTITIVIGAMMGFGYIKKRFGRSERNTGNLPSVYY